MKHIKNYKTQTVAVGGFYQDERDYSSSHCVWPVLAQQYPRFIRNLHARVQKINGLSAYQPDDTGQSISNNP